MRTSATACPRAFECRHIISHSPIRSNTPISTYPTEGKVIFLATPGEKRSELKTVGETCTSLLSEFNMACSTIINGSTNLQKSTD